MSVSMTLETILSELKPLLPQGNEAERYKALAPLLLVAAIDGELAESKPEMKEAFDGIPFDESNPTHLEDARGIAARPFFNTSPYELATLGADSGNLAAKLKNYLDAFSPNVRELLEWLKLKNYLQGAKIEKLVAQLARYSQVLRVMDGVARNALFDEIAKVSVAETAEKAFEAMTPRDVVALVVELCLAPHRDLLAEPGIAVRLYDPAFGTGGFLTAATRWLRADNEHCSLVVRGHEHTPRTAAIGRGNLLVADLLGELDEFDLRGESSLGIDGAGIGNAHYVMVNPPYGSKWAKDKAQVVTEEGVRFRALPSSSDGQMLFMQQALHRLEGNNGRGNRAVVVSNGSPLFTGAAGSGPSRIRQYFIENDWLDSIVALPAKMYFNTPINTYLWVFDKNKPLSRKGKVRLVDASFLPETGATTDTWQHAYCQKARRPEGDKRVEMTAAHRAAIADLVGAEYVDNEAVPGDLQNQVKIFANDHFGYHRITVDQPLRMRVNICRDAIKTFKASKAWQAIGTIIGKKDAEKKQALASAKQARMLKVFTATAKAHKTDANAFMTDLRNSMATTKVTVDGKGYKLSLTAEVAKAVMDHLFERDPTAAPLLDKDGQKMADPTLRDYENVPFGTSIEVYMKSEVLPHVEGAWVEGDPVVGYEIPFTREFYVYKEPRKVAEISADIKRLEEQLGNLVNEVLQ